MIYLDTSVLTAYYCPEPNSDLIEQIISQIKQPVISPLTEVELFSALSKKVRETSLLRDDANRIATQFQSHIHQNLFTWVTIEPQHYQMAKHWIAQFNTPLRTLDAIHLALSFSNNLRLITADTRLAKAAKLFEIDVDLISDPSTINSSSQQ